MLRSFLYSVEKSYCRIVDYGKRFFAAFDGKTQSHPLVGFDGTATGVKPGFAGKFYLIKYVGGVVFPAVAMFGFTVFGISIAVSGNQQRAFAGGLESYLYIPGLRLLSKHSPCQQLIGKAAMSDFQGVIFAVDRNGTVAVYPRSEVPFFIQLFKSSVFDNVIGNVESPVSGNIMLVYAG